MWQVTHDTWHMTHDTSVGKKGQENMFSSNRIFSRAVKEFSKKELSFCQNLFFFHKLLLNKSMQYQGKENSSIFNVSSTFSIKVESG